MTAPTVNPYAVRVEAASVEFIPRRLARPMQLSTSSITEVTEARVAVRVDAGGRTAVGRSCIYLSDNWAWPDLSIPHADRDLAMRKTATTIATRLPELVNGVAHPLELGLRLAAAARTVPIEGPHDPSRLARILCASPFDAAIHDATGIALGRSALDLYDVAVLPAADRLFPGVGARGPIARMLGNPPRQTLDAWWIVGRDDAPADLRAAVTSSGYRCFKLKLSGKPRDDAAFTAAVHDAAIAAGVPRPVISVDYNGICRSPEPVLEYLDRLAADRSDAFAALAYLEQPVPADLDAYPFNWGLIGRQKPVLVDEGLTTLEMLPVIEAQRWSGLALKTAKGHSLCIVAAAWALQRGLDLSFQDLTNPGLAAIHTALFAARLPTVNGAEINSPQFTPAANAAWLPRLSGLFEPRDGIHVVPNEGLAGLGSMA